MTNIRTNPGCHYPGTGLHPSYCWWFRNPANSPVEVGSFSSYLQGFILYFRWLGIGNFWTINSMYMIILKHFCPSKNTCFFFNDFKYDLKNGHLCPQDLWTNFQLPPSKRWASRMARPEELFWNWMDFTIVLLGVFDLWAGSLPIFFLKLLKLASFWYGSWYIGPRSITCFFWVVFFLGPVDFCCKKISLYIWYEKIFIYIYITWKTWIELEDQRISSNQISKWFSCQTWGNLESIWSKLGLACGRTRSAHLWDLAVGLSSMFTLLECFWFNRRRLLWCRISIYLSIYLSTYLSI